MADMFGDNTGFYFYSSVFQGNMALLALVGVFAVYKLQQLSHSVETNGKELVDYVRDRIGHRSLKLEVELRKSYSDVEGLIVRIATLRGMDVASTGVGDLDDALVMLRANPIYQLMCTRYTELLDIEKSVRTKMKTPFYWTLGVIIGSLVLLALTHAIHKNLACLEFVPLLLMTVANVWALNENTQYIFLILKRA
jgi:hypothetical protein